MAGDSEGQGPPPPPPPEDPETRFMRRLQRESEAGGDADTAVPDEGEAWLVTYLDTFTLLLTVFVLMIATEGLGRDSAQALKQAIGEMTAPGNSPDPETMPAVLDLEYRVTAAARVARLGDRLVIRRARDALVVAVSDSVLFDSGGATLGEAGRRLVGRLAGVIGRAEGIIEVIGHTDAHPVATERFPSNRALSSARAAAVVDELVASGLAPRRLRAVGLADTEPVASNATADGRARNRRVEFRLRVPEGR